MTWNVDLAPPLIPQRVRRTTSELQTWKQFHFLVSSVRHKWTFLSSIKLTRLHRFLSAPFCETNQTWNLTLADWQTLRRQASNIHKIFIKEWMEFFSQKNTLNTQKQWYEKMWSSVSAVFLVCLKTTLSLHLVVKTEQFQCHDLLTQKNRSTVLMLPQFKLFFLQAYRDQLHIKTHHKLCGLEVMFY